MDSKDNSYYYLNNYHGDVIKLTDIAGDIVNSYSYDAFGNTLEVSEQVHNRFRYSDEQYDPITNQYYLRARLYNPIIGRFIQEDEYRGDGLNLYAYVGNNPVNYFDSTGYATQCEKKIYDRKMNKQEYKEYMRLQREKVRDGDMSKDRLNNIRENIGNGFKLDTKVFPKDYPIRAYRGKDLNNMDDIYIADKRLLVEMPYEGKELPNKTNAEEWLRDSDYYWEEIYGR